jgi:hypothetical protein
MPGSEIKSGEIICNLTKDLLQQWNCTDNVVNLVSDTTASNTGHVTAACVCIQELLQRPVLWSGCRHHIGEIIISQVFNDMKIETSKSPDVMLFHRLRQNWEALMQVDTGNLKILKLGELSGEALPLVLSFNDEALTVVSEKQMLKRDFYKEFCELCAVFLTGDLTDFTFK